MKKFLSAILALSLFVACNTGGEDIPPVDEPNPDQTTTTSITEISARIDNATRAAVVVDSDDYSAYWSKSDALFVTDMSSSANFTLTSGEGSISGKFAGKFESEKQTIYALYPASAVSLKTGVFSLTIPTA
ncbi:MAG: hypothetical protein IJO90_07155 [Alistipes sp.]|nr:hypothetical protein [Alistipes sp.]